MRFHVRGVDHLCVCGSSVSSKLPEQVFPDATPRPAHKAIIDRCRRSILGRAIAPATAAFQNMHDAADDAAVVRPLDAPYIRRQMRFDPYPLLVAQPKQVPAHNPDPLPTTNQDRIVRAKKLMSSDPSLPPQVLITSDPGNKDLNSVDWLIRKYALTVLPSVGSLKILRDEKSTVAAIKPMIGFGDPVFDRTTQTAGRPKAAALNRSLTSFYRGMLPGTNALAEALPALPETADELRAIAKILGAKSEDIKLGEAASVTDIKHERLSNYRVVYFATHALVAGEVEKFAKVKAEPALVLTIPEKPTEDDDGLLRASDVAMLKMNADFVVLSACNTAAGDKPGAEALSGLARAFLYAGAKSLVVSHWEVDSDATVELMDGLFEALKANPHFSHAEALQASMLRMIANSSKPEWAQPQFWAPFVVVGEPQKH